MKYSTAKNSLKYSNARNVKDTLAQILVYYCFIAFFFGFVSGCFFTTEKIIAQVGRYTITDSNVKQKNEIARFVGDSQNQGLETLKKELALAAILEDHQGQISPSTLESEATSLEKNSTSPNQTIQIQNIFGKSRNDYLKIFVLPVYAQKVLFSDVFLKTLNLSTEEERTSVATKQKYDEWIESERKRLKLL